ncbi:hypothetical protein Tco_1394693 [Tanacetum coccineum]
MVDNPICHGIGIYTGLDRCWYWYRVIVRFAIEIVWSVACCLSEFVACLLLSAAVCSRSSSYLCDSVLCTCLICLLLSAWSALRLPLFGSLSVVESVFVCCSSSTYGRISLLMNMYLSAALCLSLFGSLCCCLSACICLIFRVFLSNSQCSIVSLR